MASNDSQINKPQRGRPKRAELPDVNINTGAQSINIERVFLNSLHKKKCLVISSEFYNEKPLEFSFPRWTDTLSVSAISTSEVPEDSVYYKNSP